MNRYYHDCRNAVGDLVPGASVTFYTDSAGTTLASLYTAAQAVAPNPTTADTSGFIDVYAIERPLYYKVGSGAVRPVSPAAPVPNPVVNVKDYGAKGNGTTDDSAAIQAAVDSRGATGGVVLFPPGTYLLSTATIDLPPAMTGRLVLSGYGATIKLSTNAPRFLDVAKDDDHDTFQHITIEGFDVNVNSIGGQHHTIFGNYEAGSYVDHVNFDDIVIRDVYAYGATDSTNTATDNRIGVFMSAHQTTASEATQNYVTNILIENVRVEGGEGGLRVVGTCAAASQADVNTYLDNITVRDCYHDRTAAPASLLAITNFHFGSNGYGGRLLVENCTGLYSGDCGLEVNAFHDALIKGCVEKDCFVTGFYHTNYNSNVDEGQRVVFEDCYAENTASGLGGKGYTVGESFSVPVNTVVLRDCSYRATRFYVYGAVYAGPHDARPSVRELVIDGFRAAIDGYARASASDTTGYVFQLEPDDCRLVLRDIDISISGTDSGGGCVSWVGIAVNPSGDSFVDIDGYTVSSDVTDTTDSKFQGIQWGRTTGAEVKGGTVRRFRPTFVNASDTSPRATLLNSTTILTLNGAIVYEGCDLSGLTAASATACYALTASQIEKTRWVDCKMPTVPAPAAITTKITLTVDEITAAAAAVVRTTAVHGLTSGDWVFLAASNSTPVIDGWRQVTVTDTTHFSVPVETSGAGNSATCQPAYTNRDLYDEDVVVTGGTVTAIQLSTNAGTTWTTTGLTAGIFRLRCGDIICITNSSAPTTTKVPRP